MRESTKLPVMDSIDDIGNIGNHYGGLQVATLNGKYYFGIEGITTVRDWEEISEELYKALKSHEISGIVESVQLNR